MVCHQIPSPITSYNATYEIISIEAILSPLSSLSQCATTVLNVIMSFLMKYITTILVTTIVNRMAS